MAGRGRRASRKARPTPIPKEIELEKAPAARILRHFSSPFDWREAGIKRTLVVRRGNWRRANKCGPGNLSGLPPEILYKVLFLLDFPSLGRLCGTNTFFEAVIKGIPSYKLVMEHCSQALRRPKVPRYKFLAVPTLGQMHQAFTNPYCSSNCGRLGNVLIMPTWSRSCRSCIKRKLALASLHVPGLSQFCDVPALVVSRIRESVGDRTDDARPPTSGPWAIQDPSAEEDVMTTYHAALDRDIEHSVRDFKDRSISEITSPFVFFDPESNKAEFGRQCAACNRDNLVQDLSNWLDGNRKRIHRPIFTAKGMVEHVRGGGCPGAKNVWERRNQKLRVRRAGAGG